MYRINYSTIMTTNDAARYASLGLLDNAPADLIEQVAVKEANEGYNRGYEEGAANATADEAVTIKQLADALKQTVEWAEQYENVGMDEWTRQVLTSARAALRMANR